MNKKREIFYYIVFGILTTLVNIVSYYIFTKILNIDYRISTTIAWFFSIVFAYFTNKVFVFKSREMDILTLTKEFSLFIFYRVLSYLMDLGLMVFLVEWFNVNDLIAKIFSNILVVILNYIFSRYFIFRSSKK